jgi:hypothetical protein
MMYVALAAGTPPGHAENVNQNDKKMGGGAGQNHTPTALANISFPQHKNSLAKITQAEQFASSWLCRVPFKSHSLARQ